MKKWLDDTQAYIKEHAEIYSFFGRKRRLPNAHSRDNQVASHEIRSGVNALVQSVSSDLNLFGGIDMQKYIRETGMDAKIFALVHDSILAEVKEEEVELYCEKLQEMIQKDRGIMIPGTPVGCDFEIDEDYSMGKFKKHYGL